MIKVVCLTPEEIRSKLSEEIISEYNNNDCNIREIESYHRDKRNKNAFFVREFAENSFKYEEYYYLENAENRGINMPFTSWIPKDYVKPFSKQIMLFEDE